MAEREKIGCFVGSDGAASEQIEVAAILDLPDSSLKACSLGFIGDGGVEDQPCDRGCVVHGASIDDAVGGEGDVVVEAVVTDEIVEIDAVDCVEINAFPPMLAEEGE